MHEPTPTRETGAGSPSSSRMLASYFTDIEQLLEEQRWDAALREACDLPRIAVALSDPQLRCSGEEVGVWCRQWIPAAQAPGDVPGVATGQAADPSQRPSPPARCAACSCGGTSAPRPAASPRRDRGPGSRGDRRRWKPAAPSSVPRGAGMRAAAATTPPCRPTSRASRFCASRASLHPRLDPAAEWDPDLAALGRLPRLNRHSMRRSRAMFRRSTLLHCSQWTYA